MTAGIISVRDLIVDYSSKRALRGERTDMAPYLPKLAATLSRGLRQRLAMAIVHEPEVLLLEDYSTQMVVLADGRIVESCNMQDAAAVSFALLRACHS